MSDRQWPVTKLGTAWLAYHPEDGWSEFDNPADAEACFGQIVDHLRDEASEAWHESADTAAWGIWIPIERLRLEATAWPDDDTEDGERCRSAGWDAFLSGNPEKVEPDAAAIDFCVRREAAAFASMRERVEALEAEVARLRPLRALRDRIPATKAPFVLTYHPDADPGDGSGWVCEIGDWSTRSGTLGAVITAACDRLGVCDG